MQVIWVDAKDAEQGSQGLSTEDRFLLLPPKTLKPVQIASYKTAAAAVAAPIASAAAAAAAAPVGETALVPSGTVPSDTAPGASVAPGSQQPDSRSSAGLQSVDPAHGNTAVPVLQGTVSKPQDAKGIAEKAVGKREDPRSTVEQQLPIQSSMLSNVPVAAATATQDLSMSHQRASMGMATDSLPPQSTDSLAEAAVSLSEDKKNGEAPAAQTGVTSPEGPLVNAPQGRKRKATEAAGDLLRCLSSMQTTECQLDTLCKFDTMICL